MSQSLKPSVNAVLEEAMTWIGTPWHHGARVKGVGVDCLQFLVAVYTKAGLISNVDPGKYPRDWHLHKNEARFINGLLRFTTPVGGETQPGDVVMFSYGRHAAHGSIYLGENQIIHAWRDAGCVTVSPIAGQLLVRYAGAYRVRGL